MKGRLWICDRQWKRLHSQAVEFDHWPRATRSFQFTDSSGERQRTGCADVVEAPINSMVRFTATGAHFELEKL